MVSILSKKRSTKPAPDPLATVESQLTTLREQLLVARCRCEEIRYELDSIASTPDARAAHLQEMKAALTSAEREEATKSEYTEMLLGRAGQADLDELRERIRLLYAHIESVEALQAQAAKELANREKELRSQLAAQEKICVGIDDQTRAALGEKERLTVERGRAVLAEMDSLLTGAERLEAEQNERAQQARRVAAQARADAFQRLDQWPALRRDLASRHRIREDATSEALAAMIALLDILIVDGVEMEQCRAGVPLGVPAQMSAEFELELQSLIAAGAGESYVLAVKRERLVNLLSAYRRNLAQV